MKLELTEEEIDYLSNYIPSKDGSPLYNGSKTNNPKEMRCTCGHLWALHNGHCCSFCMVPGCKCEES